MPSGSLSSLTPLLFQLHLFSCFAMTGAIWLVQLVVYPLFAYFADDKLAAAHALHSNNITLIVGPLMLVELFTALYLVVATDAPLPRWWLVLNLVLVLVLWGHTFFVAVPLHNRLTVAESAMIVPALVRANWTRTLLWSVRAIVFLLFQLGRGS